jgi:5-methylthioadenosine/S-adenosylhomocysteine deaminase
MRLLIEGGTVLPMTESDPVLERASISIEGDRITGVGDLDQVVGLEHVDERIDATGCIILPGLINAHTHTPMTLMRSLRDDRGSFMVPNAEPMLPRSTNWIPHIQPDDYYWSSRLAIAEMIRGGTTMFVDMYNPLDTAAQAVVDSGIRAGLGWEIVTVRQDPKTWLPYDEATAQRTFEECARFAADWHGKGDGRVTTLIAPHETTTCHEPWLSRSAQLAEELGRDITIHVAESQFEVDFCRQKYGWSPAELLDRSGILGCHTLGAHSLFVSDEDIDLLSRYSYHAISCPQGNLKLAKPMTRVAAMLQSGLNVALGTDSTLTNNNLDLWEEIRLTALMQKHLTGDAAALPGLTALRMATAGAARAVHRAEDLGTIEVGKQADLILVSTHRPHWHPLEGVLPGNLLYASAAADVRTVLVAGQVLMRDWEIVAFDEEEVIEEVDRRVRRLRAALGLAAVLS